MQVNVIVNAGTAELRLSGRFDFNAHREFRNAYEAVIADPLVTALNVNMGGVDYLDSSALGMLLMLRDKAGIAGKALALTQVRGQVRQVLEIVNFGKLFSIT